MPMVSSPRRIGGGSVRLKANRVGLAATGVVLAAVIVIAMIAPI